MKYSNRILGLAAVAGLSFVLGRAIAPQAITGAANASPVALLVQHEERMTPEMQAWMEAGTPSAHHQRLETLVGTFDGEFKIWHAPGTDPMISTGTVKRKWILDGRFVREQLNSQSDWGSFEGLGLIGYNNTDGVFELAWLDNHGTTISLQTGTYNIGTSTVTFDSSYRNPATGKLIKGWSKLNLSDPDRHELVMYQITDNGDKFKSFEGTFSRTSRTLLR